MCVQYVCVCVFICVHDRGLGCMYVCTCMYVCVYVCVCRRLCFIFYFCVDMYVHMGLEV